MNAHDDRRAARRQADTGSVTALVSLLQDVASSPAKYSGNTDLRSALRSQGALAKYVDKSIGILSMSLNHQKRIAEHLPGGYQLLDGLRLSASTALAAHIAEAARGRGDTKYGMRSRIKELEAERQLLLQDLFVLQRAYDLRCIQARNYAQCADEATRLRCAKEQREIDASFSLRKKHIKADNVRAINGEPRDRPS